MNSLIDRLIQFEEDIRYQEQPTADEPEFIHMKGSLPVLISAPHGAVHTRNGRPKEEDEFTGGLAQLIGHETGAHVLYARRKSSTDPNVDPTAPYKHMIGDIVDEYNIGFVLDLHGVKADRPHGIELGTARGESCSEEERRLIIRIFREHGFVPGNPNRFLNLWIDQLHTGAGNDQEERVINFVRKRLNISAAQFELNAHIRVPKRKTDATQEDKSFEGNPDLIIKTIQTFVDIVNCMAEKHNPGN